MIKSLDDLRERVDSSYSELGGKLQAAEIALREKINDGISTLRTSVEENRRAVAEIQGTIKTAKLILVASSAIGVLLVLVGVNEFIKDRDNLKQLVQETEIVMRENAAVVQAALVDALEAEFGKEASLDALRDNKDARSQIKELATRIQETSKRLEENKRTTYFYVGEALEPYLQHRCQDVLAMLDRVSPSDRNRFTYAYMRGACLLEMGKGKEADQWLATAAALSGGRKASMTTNLSAVSKLGQWRATNEPKFIDDAITLLEFVIERDPTYTPAYLNLACAYAARRDFKKVTEYLTRPSKLAIRTGDSIVERIRDDLSRPSDQYLEVYVRDYLRIKTPFTEPGWKAEITRALQF